MRSQRWFPSYFPILVLSGICVARNRKCLFVPFQLDPWSRLVVLLVSQEFDMNRKLCISVFVAMLATASLCRPMSDVESTRQEPLRKLLATSGLQRRDLLASLSHDQRHMMSQLLPQLYAELSNSEDHLHPMHDRDYNGWMDFGRRSSENPALDS
ncbi:gastrin/cholecystokinin-like peptide [Bombina bombina]|uniref:gastrin/cholecystokinin-like peptide n=1 Tax=Bombina bombina TaxID=8345 RepID=UPI00235B242C|nr:gastrin/cholecystokinin-like peptide [Bombina bombina]